MSTETNLPEPLNMAVAHIEELRGIIATRYADHTGEVHPSRVDRTARQVASCDEAIDAIRAEHAQRVTLQRHAADQAQRIADMIRYSDDGIAQAQAALQERLTLDRANRGLVARIAELEAEITSRARAPNRPGGPMRMIVCSVCGNKRCPKANDCRNACTGSNEPGQPGSAYPAVPTLDEITAALEGAK